jgi:hypothetical protein
MIPLERNEIFLTLSLPPLTWGVAPSISFGELNDLLKLNLTSSDFQACSQLYLLNDIENARAFWLKNPFSPLGQYDEETLKTQLINPDRMPLFFSTYLENFPSNEERLANFEELLKKYYLYLQKSPYEFIRWWGAFEEKARATFQHFRSKERPNEIDEHFSPLELIFTDQNLTAAELAESINHFLFERVEHHVSKEDPFSFERIFAYIVQFYLISLSLEVVPK